LPGNQDNCSMSKNNFFLLLNIVKVLINCNVLVYYCIDALQFRVVHFTFQMYYELKHWCRASSFYKSDGRWFCPQWPGWILVAQPCVDA
jgi:uncharacterized membrane protein (DUF106 family)